MRFLARSIAGLLGVLVSTCEAKADLVRYDFTANKSFVESGGASSGFPSFMVGGDEDRTLSGYFVLDRAAIGPGALVDFVLTSPLLDGRSFVREVPHRLQENFALTSDLVGFEILLLRAPLTGPEVLSNVELYLENDRGIDDGLHGYFPTGEFNLAPFEIRRLRFYVQDAVAGWGYMQVEARLTSFTGTALAEPVPAPSTLALLGSALAVLLAWRPLRVS